MSKIRDCILRLRQGVGLREIERQLSLHRTIIRRLKTMAAEKGWLDHNIPMPDEKNLYTAWESTAPKKISVSAFDTYFEEIKTWHDEGYAVTAIYQLIRGYLTCSIHQLRRYLKKTFPPQVKPVMVRTTFPGEALEVDFCYLGIFWDTRLNKMKKVWLFSARLRHSRKAYRKIVTNQKVSTFIECHIDAFEFFGGVPGKVVLDNLKAGVIRSCIDNDQLNRSYREMAEYYNVLIDPCQPRKPEHKGGVENDMRYVQSSFLPLIKEKQKQQPKLDLVQIQSDLDMWDNKIANVRIVYGIGRTPLDLFETEEKQALKPLPPIRWDIPKWFQCIVRRDWRIMYDYSYYSVPYTFIGKTVDVCVTKQSVRIFHDHKEIAFHSKATKKWDYQRSSSHAPPFQEAVLTCNREGLLMKAEEVGPSCQALAEKILSNPLLDKLKAIRCLLKLALKYSKERLEKACERALHYNTLRYNCVKNILENNLDQQPLDEARPPMPSPVFKHARDPREYRSQIPYENQGG